MFGNTQTSLRIRRPPLCLLTLVANADLTSESGERRLVSQPIGRVTAHNPVNCILVILTPSCEYPVDRGCRRSSTRVKSLLHAPCYQRGSWTRDLMIRRQACKPIGHISVFILVYISRYHSSISTSTNSRDPWLVLYYPYRRNIDRLYRPLVSTT